MFLSVSVSVRLRLSLIDCKSLFSPAGIVFSRDVRGENARGAMSCENRIVIIAVNAFLMSIGGRVINARRTFSIAFFRLSIPIRAYSYNNRKCNTSSRCHERAPRYNDDVAKISAAAIAVTHIRVGILIVITNAVTYFRGDGVGKRRISPQPPPWFIFSHPSDKIVRFEDG